MAIFKLTQIIKKPVEEVFDTVVHIENFPKWSPRNPSARKLSEGEIGEGTRFELEIKGFGMVSQELQEFKRNRQVRVVPHIKMFTGGHRFIFTAQSNNTRIDHEIEMNPKGFYILFAPIMWMTGKKNLKETIEALQKYLESR